MTLDDYILLLETADERLTAANIRLLTEAIDDLKAYGQAIGHRRTGLMDASMHRLGPFPIGQGVLEASFISGADYAETEVSRGGSHDWATRTIAENDARILQLQLEVENALIAALTS
jgi:hypothetical protein